MGRIVGLVLEGKKGNKYSSMKVEELKVLCNKRGIEFGSKVTKDELIKLLVGTE